MNRLKSDIRSGNACDIIFDTKGLPADVGNINPIGKYNANQAVIGRTNDNVQSAIEGLYSIVVDPIKVGGIYITTEQTTPSALKHIETFEFFGDEISNTLMEDSFFILGERFRFPSNTSIEVIITQILERFEALVAQEKLITSVVRKSAKVLEFTFIDSVPKSLNINYSKNGISYQSTTDTQGRPGYGTWIKIGQEDKFSETLHYYKRIA